VSLFANKPLHTAYSRKETYIFCEAVTKHKAKTLVTPKCSTTLRHMRPWVMSRTKELCHTWMSHVSLTPLVHKSRDLFPWLIRVRHMTHSRAAWLSHMNESCHMWMSHVTCAWVMSHVTWIKISHSTCCSVLQSVAVFCSVLQCVAVCCSELQCVAVCCSVCCSASPCVAVCCRVLQWVAVCCRKLPANWSHPPCCNVLQLLQCVAVVAVCCSVRYSVLQTWHYNSLPPPPAPPPPPPPPPRVLDLI